MGKDLKLVYWILFTIPTYVVLNNIVDTFRHSAAWRRRTPAFPEAATRQKRQGVSEILQGGQLLDVEA